MTGLVWEWKSIPGWEGVYEISDNGQVRSVDRFIRVGDKRRRASGRVLKAWIDQHGYFCVRLCRRGGSPSVRVHALVALAFIGPRPEGMQVAHYDGDQLNNTAENLRYATPSENILDQVRHGRHSMTKKTHCPWGHVYDRVLPQPNGQVWRRCLTCHRERELEAYHESRKKKMAA